MPMAEGSYMLSTFAGVRGGKGRKGGGREDEGEAKERGSHLEICL